MWPSDAESLRSYQRDLAAAEPPPAWKPGDEQLRLGGCWVCFPRGISGPGAAGDRAWAAAVTMSQQETTEATVVDGVTGAPYEPGLLALRLGPLLEQAVLALHGRPDVLLVDGTGRDHPRRAGLAVHLGATLELPTAGVTHRPLAARGDWPHDRRGATSPLSVEGEVVARWVRTQPGVRPLVVHPGWRVDLSTAVELVLATTERQRTPEPLRHARQAARIQRVEEDRRTISPDHRGA
jgi:deoxyribonuclease V